MLSRTSRHLHISLKDQLLNACARLVFFAADYESDRMGIISGYELGLSEQVIRDGLSIDSITHPGGPISLRDKPDNFGARVSDDYMYPGAYAGSALHPYESVFLKSRRYPDDLANALSHMVTRNGRLKQNRT